MNFRYHKKKFKDFPEICYECNLLVFILIFLFLWSKRIVFNMKIHFSPNLYKDWSHFWFPHFWGYSSTQFCLHAWDSLSSSENMNIRFVITPNPPLYFKSWFKNLMPAQHIWVLWRLRDLSPAPVVLSNPTSPLLDSLWECFIKQSISQSIQIQLCLNK